MDLQSYAHRQWWVRTRLVTSILVNMGNIMERADEQILPALYGFVAASFHIGPTQLGYLTLSRALVQAVASPLGGILGKLAAGNNLSISCFQSLHAVNEAMQTL